MKYFCDNPFRGDTPLNKSSAAEAQFYDVNKEIGHNFKVNKFLWVFFAFVESLFVEQTSKVVRV